MIDLTKKYKTANGKRVINLKSVPLNDAGCAVTYPIKGSIVIKEKPLELVYCIWSTEGVYDVVWGSKPGLNLVEVKEETER